MVPVTNAVESCTDPTEQHAGTIVADVFGQSAETIVRFPTGSGHFVYDVRLPDGRAAVVRISRPDAIEAVRGALYWAGVLQPKGVPLPRVMHANLSMARYPFPAMVLQRLPGHDLGAVYRRLSRFELQRLAERLAAIQDIVTALPPGRGFGYATRQNGPFPQASWAEVVTASLARSRRRIVAAGIIDDRVVDAVQAAARPFADYLAAVRPVPFLHDITTKNVIVNEGHLSGIVDVDDLCFGDPLLLLALIRMALLAHEFDPAYYQEWVRLVAPDARQTAVLDLYTALYCVDFMSELGLRSNREPAPVDPSYLARLQALLTRLLERIA